MPFVHPLCQRDCQLLCNLLPLTAWMDESVWLLSARKGISRKSRGAQIKSRRVFVSFLGLVISVVVSTSVSLCHIVLREICGLQLFLSLVGNRRGSATVVHRRESVRSAGGCLGLGEVRGKHKVNRAKKRTACVDTASSISSKGGTFCCRLPRRKLAKMEGSQRFLKGKHNALDNTRISWSLSLGTRKHFLVASLNVVWVFSTYKSAVLRFIGNLPRARKLRSTRQ